MNQSRTNGNNGGRAGIVDKLNDAVSSLRRDRDEARRAHDVAKERLRIATEERSEAEQTTEKHRTGLETLIREESAAREEMLKFEADVDRLTVEAKILHSDLLMKRQKMSTIEDRINSSSVKDRRSLIEARNALDDRNRMTSDIPPLLVEGSSIRAGSKATEEKDMGVGGYCQKDRGGYRDVPQNPSAEGTGGDIRTDTMLQLQHLLSDPERLYYFPDIILRRVEEINAEVTEINSKSATLRRRIDGYGRNLHISIEGDQEHNGTSAAHA